MAKQVAEAVGHTGTVTVEIGPLHEAIRDARGDAYGQVKRVFNDSNAESEQCEYTCKEYLMHANMLRKLENAANTIWQIDRVYRKA